MTSGLDTLDCMTTGAYHRGDGHTPTQAMLDCARSLPLTEKIECGVSSPDVATLSMLPFT